jgi:hypothetical protein
LSSSDLLVLPELVVEVNTEAGSVAQYFPHAYARGSQQPGNGSCWDPLSVTRTTRPDARASADEDLWVTARVTPSFDSVAQVSLYYRILFGREARAPMLDDGNSHDGAAG